MKLLCLIFGHKWEWTYSPIEYNIIYHRIFMKSCLRCKKNIVHEAWGFCKEAGSLNPESYDKDRSNN